MQALQGFLQSPQPQKALVLSFHGWSGTGKNFVARMVANRLYRDGLKSDCVRLFVSLLHFPHHNYVDSYKVRANNMVGVRVLPSSHVGQGLGFVSETRSHSAVLVTAEKCLHSLKASPPLPFPELSRLRCARSLGHSKDLSPSTKGIFHIIYSHA